ncbi:MAG: V-type ATP synthase subunit E [Dehalococcoidales bacterium]
MTGMGKIGEAIRDRVKVEADQILEEARTKARQEIEQAKKQYQARAEYEKNSMLQHAREEAVRIEAQAKVKARQELSRAKANVINEIIDRVKKDLEASSGNETSVENLLREALSSAGTGKVRAYLSPKDTEPAKKLLDRDRELASRIVEIKEFDSRGGVIVEDKEGKIRIDNSYETRLEMLLPRMLPEIGRELFPD